MELQWPQTTTIFRWVLRVILICFLVWLVRRQQEGDEEEEEEEPQPEATRQNAAKPRAAPPRSGNRPAKREYRDPYGSRDAYRDPVNNSSNGREYGAPLRQRQRSNYESNDHESVIDRLSKPKEMWEARRAGEAPQVRRTPAWAANPKTEADVAAPATAQAAADQDKDKDKEKEKVPPSSSSCKVQQKTMLHGHMRPVTSITWNMDCNLIFTCGKDKIVCVWRFPEGDCLGTYEGHNGAVWSCSINSDSSWLVSAGADRLVIVWEARAAKELARVELPGVVRCVEWAGETKDGVERFVTCHNKFGAKPPEISVWTFDGTSISQVLHFGGLPTSATFVKWGHRDEVLTSAHENGELVFWSAADGKEISRIKAHDGVVSKFDFSMDREIVATVSLDMRVKLWDIADLQNATLAYEAESDRPLNGVALGPMRRADVVGLAEQRLASCCVIAAGGQDVRDVARTATTSDQFETLLFRLGDEQEVPRTLVPDGTVKGHFGPVHTLAFSSDGCAIASGSEDGCVRLHVIEKFLPPTSVATQ
uniref:Serine-threonine kinase receptor-associated protein n=1 Tax=Noctiluca scintillans TaxID=2966 RepID=A0A7S1AHF7_NOCSC|mmetsp:Transcript_45636/g.121052  ORF Transcript_45636/g.121052 Transcript_45636/m.121052 type:complete len:535 (+) Transcript_45636:68-1672(+)